MQTIAKYVCDFQTWPSHQEFRVTETLTCQAVSIVAEPACSATAFITSALLVLKIRRTVLSCLCKGFLKLILWPYEFFIRKWRKVSLLASWPAFWQADSRCIRLEISQEGWTIWGGRFLDSRSTAMFPCGFLNILDAGMCTDFLKYNAEDYSQHHGIWYNFLLPA